MKKLKKNITSKNALDNSVKIIYDEITQNLCLAKLTLGMSEKADSDIIKESIKKSILLIGKSIQQLRIVGNSINEIKKLNL